MSVQDEVREAHDRFYTALNRIVNSDNSLMDDAWYHDENATTVHPMGQWAVGWDQVSATWNELAKTLSDGEVKVSDLSIIVRGDVAYTVGIEHVTFVVMGKRVRFDANTTNIYRRGGRGWRMIHHHPDKAPAAEEAIAG